jgi:DNA (cytosine-5)-methyltransferase 1
MSRDAVKTYELNLGKHIACADVTRLCPFTSCDVLIGGPPCQGFSTLGKRDSDDPRNLLSYEMVRWARHTGAKVVVVENVSAFLNSAHHRRMTAGFRRLGYSVRSFVLNAADFGVPQNRVRSFVIASRLGVPSVQPTHTAPHITVRQALKGLRIGISSSITRHAPRQLTPAALARVSIIPAGGDKRDVMRLAPHLAAKSWLSTKSEVTDVWGRMEWDAPANTLRTNFINPSKGRYLHPVENRTVTIREAARIHSVRDSWQFHGADTSVARQIGNGVPPLLARAVAEAVLQLFSATKRRACD